MRQETETRCERCGGYAVPEGRTVHPYCDVDDRTMLLQLLASLTLVENMGDVADDVLHVLKWAGIEVGIDGEWSEEVADALGRMGITTIYGTEVGEERG